MDSRIGILNREGKTYYYAYIGEERIYKSNPNLVEIEAFLAADDMGTKGITYAEALKAVQGMR